MNDPMDPRRKRPSGMDYEGRSLVLPWFVPGHGREAMPFVYPWGPQVNEDRIVAKLDGIEEQNRVTLIALTRLQEQMNAVPDHESRLRSLERWKYGLPVTGLTALVSMGISAWSASKGG